ncbi:hypothetical protein pb186bvf_015898 [Paramecium bursaria]
MIIFDFIMNFRKKGISQLFIIKQFNIYYQKFLNSEWRTQLF